MPNRPRITQAMPTQLVPGQFTGDSPTSVLAIGKTPEIPGYMIVREIGRGGMGIVFEARQIGLNRTVALKMLHLSNHGTQFSERLRIEGEAIARLDHPNIVKIFEIGTHQGQPYFSLEYCESSLDQFTHGRPLPPREVARFVETLTRAIAHAHDRGIVHRDLKPSNILLHPDPTAKHVEGPTLARLVPKIADFGLAKNISEGVPSQRTEVVMGTPPYMAPEQITDGSPVGPSCDIHALGVILYEMLAGRAPFMADTPYATLVQVRTLTPVAPDKLNPNVPHDLATICMKCLRKEAAKRYLSAGALANDLQRFLVGKPISARPISTVESIWKWIRRQPMVAGLLASLILVFVTFIISGILFTAEIRNERDHAQDIGKRAAFDRDRARIAEHEAERRGEALRRTLAVSELTLADVAIREHNTPEALRALHAIPTEWRGWEWNYLHRRVDDSHSSVSLPPSRSLATTPNGQRVYVGGEDGRLRAVYDRDQRIETLAFRHTTPVERVVVSPDGRFAASIAKDGSICWWETSTHTLIRQWPPSNQTANSLAFFPDDNALLLSLDSRTFQRISPHDAEPQPWGIGKPPTIRSFFLSPDGRYLAVREFNGPLSLFDTTSQMLIHSAAAYPMPYTTTAFSPTNSQLVYLNWQSQLEFFDLKTHRLSHHLNGRHLSVYSIKLSSDGKQLVITSTDSRSHLLDANTGQVLRTFAGHSEAILDFTVPQQGNEFITLGQDHCLKRWDLSGGGRGKRHLEFGDVTAFDFHPSRDTIAVGHSDGSVEIISLNNLHREVKRHLDLGIAVNRIDIHPDRNLLAIVQVNGKITLWDPQQETLELLPQFPLAYARHLEFTRDGQWLVTIGFRGEAQLWDIATSEEIQRFPVESDYGTGGILINSQSMLMAARNQLIQTQLLTGKSRKLSEFKGAIISIARSASGNRLLVSDRLGNIYELAPSTYEVIKEWKQLNPWRRLSALSPDGRLLLQAGTDGSIGVSDCETNRYLFTIPGTEATLDNIRFSNDGNWLAALYTNHKLLIWDGRPIVPSADQRLIAPGTGSTP